jgi:hypothetical protein
MASRFEVADQAIELFVMITENCENATEISDCPRVIFSETWVYCSDVLGHSDYCLIVSAADHIIVWRIVLFSVIESGTLKSEIYHLVRQLVPYGYAPCDESENSSAARHLKVLHRSYDAGKASLNLDLSIFD